MRLTRIIGLIILVMVATWTATGGCRDDMGRYASDSEGPAIGGPPDGRSGSSGERLEQPDTLSKRHSARLVLGQREDRPSGSDASSKTGGRHEMAVPSIRCMVLPEGEQLETQLAWGVDGQLVELLQDGEGEPRKFTWKGTEPPRIVFGQSALGALAVAKAENIEGGSDLQVLLDFSQKRRVVLTVANEDDASPLVGVKLSRWGISVPPEENRNVVALEGRFDNQLIDVSDESGRLEFDSVSNLGQQLVLERDGFLDEPVNVDASGDVDQDLGCFYMLPVDRIAVQLRGFIKYEVERYQLSALADTGRVSFDESGIAHIAIPYSLFDTYFGVWTPDGRALRVDVPGFPRDHSPITVDVSRRAQLVVKIASAYDAWRDRNVWIGVRQAKYDPPRLIVTRKLETDTVEIDLPFDGHATVSVIEFFDNYNAWLSVDDVDLRGDRQNRVTVDLSGTTLGTYVVDEHGIGVPNTMFELRLQGRDWTGTNVTSPDGWLPLPGPEGAIYRIFGRLDENRIVLGLPVSATQRDALQARLMLTRPTVIDVELLREGVPLPWTLVQFKRDNRWGGGFGEYTGDRGLTPAMSVFCDEDPICIVSATGLFETGESYALHAGRTTIQVRRVASFELVPAGQIVAAQLTVERVGEPGALAAWIAEGRSSRTELVRDEVRVLRFGNVPLGDYEWSDPSGRRGTVEVREAGRIRVVELP